MSVYKYHAGDWYAIKHPYLLNDEVMLARMSMSFVKVHVMDDGPGPDIGYGEDVDGELLACMQLPIGRGSGEEHDDWWWVADDKIMGRVPTPPRPED